ncbi:RNase H domain-containing protein [Caerostris darwini]|uniref:RNase H domain-containing protein n=1 Tax=Caerostris darwini TaxID=1538125 RepID=A0AAV4QQ48_9ARAC|nr:RNase H domain-containing protein [Caerostris darwini]
MGFLRGVLQLKKSLGLNYEPELLIPPQNSVHLESFRINLDLGQNITKSNTDTSILRALALEILNILYPDPECLRIFTDGSLLSDSPNAGAGVFSEIFTFYVPVGRDTVFDGEIAEIRTALSQLHCHLEKFTRAVILCDSRAALLAIVSNNNPKTQDILDCHYHLENLASLEKHYNPPVGSCPLWGSRQ